MRKKFLLMGLILSLFSAMGGGNLFAQTAVTDEASLNEALVNGGDVILGSNITLQNAIEIPENVNVTLDLNGNTITNCSGSSEYVIYNRKGGTLTIKDSVTNGTISGVVYTGTESTTFIEGGTFNAITNYALLNSEGTLTINGGTINGNADYPVYSYNEGHKLVINDGVVVNGKAGCVNAYGNNGTVEINGGEFNFEGVEGKTYHIIYVSTNTSMTINGGTFRKVGDVNLNAEGGGGVCVNGGATLTVKDGTFDGAINDIDNYATTTTIEVSGGTFSDMSAKNYITEGSTVTMAGKTYTKTEDGLLEINEIKTREDLIAFADAVNGGDNYQGKLVALTTDITLTDEWTPIGNGSRSSATYTGNAFKGVFDGGGNTISSLSITSGSDNDTKGLFGVVDGGTVKNLKLTDVNINTSSKNAGAAVGLMVNNSTVDNVEVNGTLTAPDGVGGIVGRMIISGTISNCTNNAAIFATTAAAGIVGKAYYSAEGKTMNITDCVNKGAITGNYAAGGIAGLSAANISNCSNTAVIASNEAGGIVGEQIMYGTINNNENSGLIKNINNGGFAHGGIIGWLRYHESETNYPLNGIINVTNNKNTANIEATGATGGSGGIVGHVYNQANITGNINEAEHIYGGVFAAGIAGGLQQENNNLDIENTTITVSGNVSLTSIENITVSGSCKELFAYNNAPGTFVVKDNSSNSPIASVDGVYYTSLQEAINAVQNGQTITLLGEVTENVTLQEKTGLYYTIDGNGNTMNGNISVTALSDTNDNRRITIKNINFKDEAEVNVDFITSVNTNHYPRLTIEDCIFTGSGNDGDVAIRLKSSHSVIIKDCTGTGLHSFLQNTSGWNLTIENVTVTDSKSGFALGTVQGVIVKDCKVEEAAGYGIRLDADTYNNNAVIESCKINAFIPVVVRKVNTASNITFQGTNTMTETNTDGLWCAIGSSEYETNGEMPTAPTGRVKVTLNDTGLDADGIYGNFVPVVKVGGEEYDNLETALKAVTAENNVVEILDDITIDYAWDNRSTGAKFTVPVTINGNDNTIKFTATVSDGGNYHSVFRFQSEATVNNITIDLSEAEGYSNRVRAISSSANLTVNKCKFVGNTNLTNTRAIIFGEGAGTNIGNLEISITNSEFSNWKRGITDNENGQDVKTVTITGNKLTNSAVYVSAKEDVTFTGNTVEGAYVNIRSYTANNKLNVTATDNTLTENTEASYNYISARGTVIAQDDFKVESYGTLTNAYTSGTGYWGECGGNAKESFVFKFYNNDTYMGYTSLNNVDGIIDGDVYVSWNIKLDAKSNSDDFWTMAWEIRPTLAMQPNRVEQWVDGVKVAECAIEPNWSDNIFPVVAAVTDENGVILSYVNGTADFTLQDALNAGGNITILRDVNLTEGLTVAADKVVTLDLNGKTISQVKTQTAGYQMILNDGNLTINDSSEEKTGKISYTDSGNGGEYISDVIYNRAILVINGGTIENLSSATVASNGYPHAVDTYSGIRNTSVTINGGTIYCAEYSAVRMFCVSATNKADLVINEGATIKGAIDMQNGSKDAALGTLTINNGTFETTKNANNIRFANWNGGATEYGISAEIKGGSFNGGITTQYVPAAANWNKGIISGGTFANDMSEYCAPGFVCEQNEDGTYGIVDDPTNEYISTLDDLINFRNAVNAGSTYKGMTVYLAADIDLADGQTRSTESNWTPIGNSSNKFQGTFDGQNHTISNLVINGGSSSDQGFFGFTTDGEIKNVTFENAKVSGRLNVGVVAGTPYTSKYTNITVAGHVEVNGMAYVGGVGGKNAYADWTDITVNVDETSYVKAVSTENGVSYRTYVGGVIGFNGEGGHTFKNIVSNIHVIGDICDIGGIFGIAHYGNKVKNVSCSATVESTGEAEELGGIAGVWHNEKGTSVTMNDVEFTGTVKDVNGAVAGVDIVGGAYHADNETSATSGSLVIDGQEAWLLPVKIGGTKYRTLAEAATAAQDGETIELLWAEGDAPIAMNATFVGNKTVTITGTADVAWDNDWFFVGRNGEGNGHVIFDNANLTSVSNSTSLGFNVSGKKNGSNDTNNGTVEIKNSTIVLDYMINKNVIKLDNSTLTVKNGFAVGGRPGSETENGEDATATMTLSNNSKVVVNNHNGQGLGYESNGVMNIDATSSFETTTHDFLVTKNGTMNVNGTIVSNGKKLTNNGEIKFTDVSLTGINIDGTGTTRFYNEINFYGDNSVTSNINGTPFELIVNEGATLLISRFVLGYDRAITVYGNIDDAHKLTADQIASMTPSLKFNSTSGVSVGGTSTGKLTAKDAYLEFGNSSWKDSQAVHTWSFENCYVSATSFGDSKSPYVETSTWDVTFDNSVLAAKNYIKNGVNVTYNFINGSVATTGSLRIDGVLAIDETSSVTTTSQQNNVQGGVDEHGGINGTANIAGTLTIGSNAKTQLEVLDGEVNVLETGNLVLGNNTLTLDAASKMRSCGNITGAITVAEGADVEITGGTYTQDVNEWCHEYYDAINNGDGTWTVEQVMFALVRDLQEGWNWFSSFINIDGETGLGKIKSALGENGIQIKDAEMGTFVQYSTSGWNGSLDETYTSSVYSIKTKADDIDETTISVKDFTISGVKVDPSSDESAITINKGWNYIAYPLEVLTQVSSLPFAPSDGDVIKSKEASSIYYGVWVGNLVDIVPGEGYMYNTSSDNSITFNFTYPERSVKDAEVVDMNVNDNHWYVDAHKYPNNMTLIAMLSIDGEIVKDNYEVAAFANGECRGSARPYYVETLDAYVLLMTIHGEEVEELTFKYYDVNYGTEYELNNTMVYSTDAIVGSIEEPYMFNLGVLNIEESSVEDINIYPNPTTTGNEINLQAMCDKVEVFNALGVKVAEYTNVDSIDALETAGIYVIRVTIDGNARNCRLVVK